MPHQQWEYHEEHIPDQNSKLRLQQLGAEGWELVVMLPDRLHKFKRPVLMVESQAPRTEFFNGKPAAQFDGKRKGGR